MGRPEAFVVPGVMGREPGDVFGSEIAADGAARAPFRSGWGTIKR